MSVTTLCLAFAGPERQAHKRGKPYFHSPGFLLKYFEPKRRRFVALAEAPCNTDA
jgi:hypothetical protein